MIRLPLEPRILDAPVEAVWAVLGDFGNEAAWMRALDASRRDTDTARAGTVRTCELARPTLGARTVRERLVAVEPPRLLRYRTLDPLGPFAWGQNTFTLHPRDDGRTRLEAEPALQPRVPVLGWLAARLAVRRIKRLADEALDDLEAAVARRATA